MNEFVNSEICGPVALITINRPERRNALSTPILNGLGDAIDEARYTPTVRAIVLTGSGRAFCAGMDLKDGARGGSFLDPEAEHTAVDNTKAIADLFMQIHGCPKPVIACMNGDAFAGGAGLAMACDLVIAADSARIGYPEVRRGLVAAIVMHDLVRLVGDRRARQLLLTGDPISAEEALRWGLVNRVVPLGDCLDVAIALGHTLAEAGPIAQATTKRQLDEASNRPHDLRGSAAISAAVRVSDEAIEGIAAFLEKRAPRWTGLLTGDSAQNSSSDRPE